MGIRLHIALLVSLFAATTAQATWWCSNGYRALAPHEAIVSQPVPPEGRPVSTSQETLAKDWDERLTPFYNSGVHGHFDGVGGARIHYGYWEVPNAKGTLVLSHGFTENMALYKEVIFNLAERGYNVYMLDHRDHGRSTRLTPDPHKVHVDRFDDYVSDLKTFVDTVVKANGHEKFHLIGVSMGGAVAGLYGEFYPQDVEKLVLVAPMAKIKTPPYLPAFAAKAIAASATLAGFQHAYVLGGGKPTIPWIDRVPAATRLATLAEKARQNWTEAPQQDDPSFGWLNTALTGSRRMRREAHNLEMPVMLLQAGTDNRVRNDTITKLCQAIPNCTRYLYPESSHVILAQNDNVRDRVFRDLFDFLEK